MIDFLNSIRGFEVIFFIIVGLCLIPLFFLIIDIAIDRNLDTLGFIIGLSIWIIYIIYFYYIQYINEEAKEYCKFFPQTEICQELNKDNLFDKRFYMLNYEQVFEMFEKVREQNKIENYEYEKSKIKNMKID